MGMTAVSLGGGVDETRSAAAVDSGGMSVGGAAWHPAMRRRTAVSRIHRLMLLSLALLIWRQSDFSIFYNDQKFIHDRQIVQWIAVDDNQIGQLPFFERA